MNQDTRYEPSTYGDRIAGVYDSLYPRFDPAAVDLLAEVAGNGPALELGIGTGRLALPLASRGVEMHGIDASTAMIERLRAKPSGAAIPVTIGDFSQFDLPQRFSLVFVAFNTFFALTTQDAQVRCFESVAAVLRPGGVFLIEAFVPDPTRFDRDQRVSAVDVETASVMLEVTKHQPASQLVRSMHVMVAEGGIQLYPVLLRYAWPSELDLMARLAGLRLQDRWGGWDRRPFGSGSIGHISLYVKEA